LLGVFMHCLLEYNYARTYQYSTLGVNGVVCCFLLYKRKKV